MSSSHSRSDKRPNAAAYNREAVDNAIRSSNRAGRKISGREADAIHKILKGRSATR